MSEISRSLVKCRFAAKIAYYMLTKYLSRIVPRKKMTVVVEQGTLEGQYYNTQISNKPYVRFLGVPYAKPPINDLRFKPPEKHPGWSGVLHASSEGNVCLQYDMLIPKKIIGSEDCLYLNVFVPQEELNEKKAVMVFIHGGGFNHGSATVDWYSPDYLLDENVIVVTFNYRLNVFGFLNFDIDECPGNMGLKDQLFAIKWVKANISAFGGDPDNITIFGESAGAASVHCHTLSPQSTGLFQKAIMQSGCIFNSWAFNENHKEAAFNFAKNLGSQKDDPKEIIQHLKSLPAIDLLKNIKIVVQSHFLDYDFVPSLESSAVTDPFLPLHPKTLIKTASTVPIITGINDMEGLIALTEDKMDVFIDLHKAEKMSMFFKEKCNGEVINKIKNFYFSEHILENEMTRLENLCHFYSDIYFIKDFYHGFNHLLRQDVTSPVYLYEFKFNGDINAIKNIIFGTRPELRKSLKGASHADELNYLFYLQMFGFSPKPNSPEARMCKTMSKLWCNFAKTGNPNSSDFSFVWNSTSIDHPKYLSLDGDNTCTGDGLLYNSRVTLWENISELLV